MRGIRTLRFLQGVTAPLLLLIGVPAASCVGCGEGGRIRHHARRAVKVSDLRRIFPFLRTVADGRGGILGNGRAQHPRFHALRTQPALTDARAGFGIARYDDVLFFHRRRGHLSDSYYFRTSDLGPRSGACTSGKSHCGRDRDAGPVACYAERQRRRQILFLRRTIFSNLSPRLISFRTGGLITCVVGRCGVPTVEAAGQLQQLHFSDGSSVTPDFFGPIAGVMICDYFVIRKKILLVEDIYQRRGFYEFSSGFNWRAMGALAAGAGLAFIGLVVPSLRVLYDYAWFVGFAASFIVYWAVMRGQHETSKPRV